MTPEAYLELRRGIVAAGYGHEIDWAQGLKPPEGPNELADEYIHVVLNSGMKAQVARGIADRVYLELARGGSASTVFGHKAKCAAIDAIWTKRLDVFAAFAKLTTEEERFGFTAPKALRLMLGVAPCIGAITRWHLAKNWGCDVAKPDRHLERIAQHHGTTTAELCAALSKVTGDRVATVDLVIWRAANLGLIKTRDLK